MPTSSHSEFSSILAGRLTARAAFVALVLAVVCAFWVVGSEVVTVTCLVGEAVPSIPALGCLLGLLLLNPLLRRVAARLALSQQEILLIYVVLVIAVPMGSYGGMQMLFQGLSPVFYYATPENGLAPYQSQIPRWLMPSDPQVYIDLHEGRDVDPPVWPGWARAPLVGLALTSLVRDGKRVPWAAWGRPMGLGAFSSWSCS